MSITDNNGNTITNNNHIGLINPFRYRSYYYDTETKLYYLSSRYYNPEWGRFISLDNILIQSSQNNLGMNLYIYCINNPMNFDDVNGNIPKWLGNLCKKTKKVVSDVKKMGKKSFYI